MLNTDLQICGPSLESNIEKKKSKKEKEIKGEIELSQRCYSSEIIIIRGFLRFFLPVQF